MLQKFNITTYAVVLCLFGFMLFSAAPVFAKEMMDYNEFEDIGQLDDEELRELLDKKELLSSDLREAFGEFKQLCSGLVLYKKVNNAFNSLVKERGGIGINKNCNQIKNTDIDYKGPLHGDYNDLFHNLVNKGLSVDQHSALCEELQDILDIGYDPDNIDGVKILWTEEGQWNGVDGMALQDMFNDGGCL